MDAQFESTVTVAGQVAVLVLLDELLFAVPDVLLSALLGVMLGALLDVMLGALLIVLLSVLLDALLDALLDVLMDVRLRVRLRVLLNELLLVLLGDSGVLELEIEEVPLGFVKMLLIVLLKIADIVKALEAELETEFELAVGIVLENIAGVEVLDIAGDVATEIVMESCKS